MKTTAPKLPIDLTVANRIAVGRRKKGWLGQMLTVEGLHPTAGESGPSAGSTYGLIARFTNELARVGYAAGPQPLGPRGGMRIVVTGFAPLTPTQLATQQLADVLRTRAYEGGPWLRQPYKLEEEGVLPEWVAIASPAAVSLAAMLAPAFTGTLEELLAVADATAATPAAAARAPLTQQKRPEPAARPDLEAPPATLCTGISEAKARSIGSPWVRGTMRRVYINVSPEHAGLDVLYYKTGSPKDAEHHGEKLSNNRAFEYLRVLRDVKLWFDCQTSDLHCRMPPLGRVPEWVVTQAIETALGEAFHPVRPGELKPERAVCRCMQPKMVVAARPRW